MVVVWNCSFHDTNSDWSIAVTWPIGHAHRSGHAHLAVIISKRHAHIRVRVRLRVMIRVENLLSQQYLLKRDVLYSYLDRRSTTYIDLRPDTAYFCWISSFADLSNFFADTAYFCRVITLYLWGQIKFCWHSIFCRISWFCWDGKFLLTKLAIFWSSHHQAFCQLSKFLLTQRIFAESAHFADLSSQIFFADTAYFAESSPCICAD